MMNDLMILNDFVLDHLPTCNGFIKLLADKGFSMIYNDNIKKYHLNILGLHLKRNSRFKLSRNLHVGIQTF